MYTVSAYLSDAFRSHTVDSAVMALAWAEALHEEGADPVHIRRREESLGLEALKRLARDETAAFLISPESR